MNALNYSPPPSSPVPLTEEQYGIIAGELSTLTRFSGLRQALAVGRVLLDELYDGDLEAFRARESKETSLRKLSELTAERGQRISRSVLHRSVQIYALIQRLELTGIEHLTVSHFRVVLPLPEPRQRALLYWAEQRRWSVRKLESMVRGVTPSRPPAFVDEIARLADRREALSTELERIDELSEETLQDMAVQLGQIQQTLDTLTQRLHAARS